MHDGQVDLVPDPVGSCFGNGDHAVVGIVAKGPAAQVEAACAENGSGRHGEWRNAAHAFRARQQLTIVTGQQLKNRIFAQLSGEAGRADRRAEQEDMPRSMALRRQAGEGGAQENAAQRVTDQDVIAAGRKLFEAAGEAGDDAGEVFPATAVAETCRVQPGLPQAAQHRPAGEWRAAHAVDEENLHV